MKSTERVSGSAPDKAQKHVEFSSECSKFTSDRPHRMVKISAVGGGQIESEVAQIRSEGYPSVEIAFVF